MLWLAVELPACPPLDSRHQRSHTMIWEYYQLYSVIYTIKSVIGASLYILESPQTTQSRPTPALVSESFPFLVHAPGLPFHVQKPFMSLH